jgi:hypothetical protein
MRNIITALVYLSIMLLSCNSSSPKQYFDQAALNCNLLYGFAGYELERDLAQQQEKLVDASTMRMEKITRTEVVREKLAMVEENFAKAKSLGSNADANEMLKASTALYEFVIPVYKNEYTQLAALYDGNAPADKISAASKNIADKYAAKFEALYSNVVKAGTAYAEKNGIPVKQVNPSPSK